MGHALEVIHSHNNLLGPEFGGAFTHTCVFVLTSVVNPTIVWSLI
jgi:hypothetical protein